MTIKECINLEDSGITARELLANVLQKDKQYILINFNKEIDEEKIDEFFEDVKKIVDGEPMQYITHRQSFMEENYYVNENVLIPQPDTETLVEEVINLCDNITDTVKILDLCTGSGAIAISLNKALERKNHSNEIYASDISTKALEVAKKNKEINNANIKFIESNLFNGISERCFDIVVSNPPYIKTDVIKTLSKQVQNEPKIALDGGEDGLLFYKEIANEAYKYIKNKGFICLEIGYDQANEVKKILNNNRFYANVKIIKDLSNNDRCVIAQIRK